MFARPLAAALCVLAVFTAAFSAEAVIDRTTSEAAPASSAKAAKVAAAAKAKKQRARAAAKKRARAAAKKAAQAAAEQKAATTSPPKVTIPPAELPLTPAAPATGAPTTTPPTTSAPASPAPAPAPANSSTVSRSLGVYRGSEPAQVAAFEKWVGRPVPYVLEFWGRDTGWGKIDNPSWVVNRWNGSGRTVVYSTAMLPSNEYTLEAGAAGQYDEHWRNFARTYVAAGQGNAILRLGWEFNGKFYPWAAGGKEDAFAAYWRRIVDTVNSVPGADFRFDWTPLAGNTNADVERAYPGDDYVDFIGLDAYDTSAVNSSPQQRWSNIRDRRYGLAWHRDFAAAHGKPMTFPEWGLSIRTNDALGGGDNPHYIEQMHSWIGSNNVAYAMYFEYSAKDAEHRLMTGVLPSGGATYLRLFGG